MLFSFKHGRAGFTCMNFNHMGLMLFAPWPKRAVSSVV